MSNLAGGNKTSNVSFIVKNISAIGRTVKIFNQKIYNQQQFDLLTIPGISEEDIKASLLKGDLRVKLINRVLQVVSSDIDLLQFNYNERKFLADLGITSTTVTPNSVAQQASWYVDPVNGNDGNTGASSSLALKTLGELFSRLNGIILNTAITVTVLNNVPSTDISYCKLTVGKNGSFTMKGTSTTLYTGTATSRTNVARATNTPPDLTDTALSSAGAWTNYIARGNRVRLTSGASTPNAIAWPVKDLGSKKARVSNWMVCNPTQATYLAVTNDISTNDPFVIESLTKIDKLQLDVNVYDDESLTPKVVFQDLCFTNGVQGKNNTQFGSSMVAFFGCDVGYTTFDGAFDLINCACGDGVLFFVIGSRAQLQIYGGAALNSGLLINGTVIIDFGFLIQAYGINMTNPIYAWIGDVGIFDVTGAGIKVSGGGNNIIMSAFLGSFAIWGSGNSTYGMTVSGGNFVGFGTFTGASITGTTGNVGVGPSTSFTTKTWGQMPFIVSDIASGSGTKAAGLVIS